MAQSINLIPQEEKVEQQKSKVVRLSTVVSILVLVLVGIVAGYYYYSTTTKKNTIKALDRDITGLRGEIENQSEIEIVARNLSTKYSTLRTIFDQRYYYSLLLEELERRVPASIEVDAITIGRDNTFTVTGSGSDYLAISDFVKSLEEESIDPAFVNDIFTGITLNSVNLDKSSGTARYFIVVDYDGSSLTK